MRRTILIATSLSLCITACVGAPRGPAARLSESGLKASTAFSTDINRVATQLITADLHDAYAMTWQVCQSPVPEACTPQRADPAVAARRARLSEAVALRARALDALGQAYAALGREAAYDAPADLSGAAGELITGVNNYTRAISALGGGAPIAELVSQPIAAVGGAIVAEIAEQRQRARILRGSRQISAAAEKLREGLVREAQVFDTLAGYLVDRRTSVRIALLDAGLISRAEALRPLATSINATLVPSADTILAQSPAAQAALQASVEAAARLEIAEAQRRYREAIEALGALVTAHRQLEADQAVSLEDVNRVLSRFHAAVAPPEGAGEAPTKAGE